MMNPKIAKEARGLYSRAERELEHLEIARESNTELAVAEGITHVAESITHSKRNSALLFGGILGVFGAHQVIGNENFTLISSIPVNVVGGMVLGETTKFATRFHRNRVQKEGIKTLEAPLKPPSDEIKLAQVREAVRDLLSIAPEAPVKSGEVDRWVEKSQMNAIYNGDPRVNIAKKLHKRVSEFHPDHPENVSVPAFMRAHVEMLEYKRTRRSIAGEARRLLLDQAAGQAAVFGLWASSLYAFGSRYSALTGGADDVATLGLIYLFTPAKKIFTSETAHDLYNASKEAYKKVAFWKRDELPQEPIRLLEAPKQDQSIDAILLNPNDEIIIDSTQDFAISDPPDFTS